MRQVIILRFFYSSGNYSGCVVDKPVNEQGVEILLNFDENRIASFCNPVNVEYRRFIVENAGILRNAQGKGFDGVFSIQIQHCIQKLHRAFGLSFVCHEHLKNAIAERINVCVDFSIFGQTFRMLMKIFGHGKKFVSSHNYTSVKFRGLIYNDKISKSGTLQILQTTDCKLSYFVNY